MKSVSNDICFSYQNFTVMVKFSFCAMSFSMGVVVTAYNTLPVYGCISGLVMPLILAVTPEVLAVIVSVFENVPVTYVDEGYLQFQVSYQL